MQLKIIIPKMCIMHNHQVIIMSVLRNIYCQTMRIRFIGRNKWLTSTVLLVIQIDAHARKLLCRPRIASVNFLLALQDVKNILQNLCPAQAE